MIQDIPEEYSEMLMFRTACTAGFTWTRTITRITQIMRQQIAPTLPCGGQGPRALRLQG